jgi:cytidylate kinase
MYRVLTGAREYGSGGARIAKLVAEELEWRLFDSALISEIARAANVDPGLARQYDERVDSWLHRMGRRGLWHGAFEGVAAVAATDFFDAETVATLTRNVIEGAYAIGSCVIVGRGAQCILQDREDAFHVFVYAPWADRVKRVRHRVVDSSGVEDLIRLMDAQRADYIRLNFSQDWTAPHLYDLLISSKRGDEAVVSTILHAMGKGL